MPKGQIIILNELKQEIIRSETFTIKDKKRNRSWLYEIIPHINNYIAVWNDPLKNPGMPLRGFEEIKNIFMPGQLGAIIPMDHPYSELVINTWYKPVRNQLVNWLS